MNDRSVNGLFFFLVIFDTQLFTSFFLSTLESDFPGYLTIRSLNQIGKGREENNVRDVILSMTHCK